jgi:hypothetical protein
MADATPAPEAEAVEAPAAEPAKDLSAEVEKWKALAQKHEKRAKDNVSAAQELETLRLQSMTDQEKAVAAARAEATVEALRTVGGKLVAAELRAAAAGRGLDADALVEAIDGSKFLDDQGEPDRNAITAWVERIAPTADTNALPQTPRVPDLGQGVRAAAADALALNGDALTQSLIKAVGAPRP